MVEGSKKFISKFSISRVIMFLTLSDIFTWGLYTVIHSFMGLYLEKKFNGSAVQYIGVGVSIYFLTKAATQIPIGLLTDKVKTLKDDVLILILGNTLMSIPFFFYPSLQSPFPYYVLQMILGLGVSMNLVSWRKTFALNLEKGKEGMSYAVYDTIISLSMALFGGIVGYIANISQTHFDFLIVGIGICMLSSTFWISRIYILIRNKERAKANLQLVRSNIH